MTTKTDPKTAPKPRAQTPSQQEVQAAYHCHTLAQILFRQIALTHPWLLQAPRVTGQPTVGACAPPWATPGPVFG